MIDSTKIGSAEGFDFTLKIYEDPWTTVEDNDSLTPKQIEAWTEDEWFYVSAEVVASVADVELGSASYGGIEYGSFTHTDEEDNFLSVREITIYDIDNYVGSELAGQAVENAREKLAEIIKIMEENK